MLKKLIFISAFILSSSLLARGNFAAGIVVGTPTGFNFVFKQSKASYFESSLAWNFDNIDMIFTYNMHIAKRLKLSKQEFLQPYWGFGLRARQKEKDNEKETYLGVNVPFGLLYNVRALSGVEVFAELSPTMNFTPATDFDLGLALGGRYYF